MTVKKLKKFSQRQIADSYVEKLSEHIGELDDMRQRLEKVLGDAQNGKADGSIDAAHYDKLRSVEQAAQTLIRAIARWGRRES